MEGIPVYYVMQPSVDDTLNVFFLPPHIKSQSEVKIKDVVTNFPLKDMGKYYHYRFYAICDKDQKTWVDISNMGAKAPIVDNRILLKVLEIEKPHYSKIFASVAKATREESGVRPDTKPQEIRDHHQPHTSHTSGHKTHHRPVSTENRPTPPINVTSPDRSVPTQPNVQVKSPPTTNASDYEDLLGGGETYIKETKTTTTTTTQATFTSPNQGKSREEEDMLKNMSREELTAYKKQQMDKAIQDKLEFANKIWSDELKNKEEKEKAYIELEDGIRRWSGKNNQRNNIRALLCTIHEVIWQGSDWTPLSLSDLMMPAQIKKNYFKAITKFHPDKNQAADYRQRYIAERVTNELNAAWDEFRKTNPNP